MLLAYTLSTFLLGTCVDMLCWHTCVIDDVLMSQVKIDVRVVFEDSKC